MKILQINAVYGTASTGKMVRDISDKLIEQGHQSYVMWATGCRGETEGAELIRIGNSFDHKIHALLRRLDGGEGRHSKFATKRALKKILEISPDVVHLHNLHSNYIHMPTLFAFLAKHNIPTLMTLHDCWFVGGYCMHYINHNCRKWLDGCKDCPAVGKRFKKKVERNFAERHMMYSNVRRLAVNGVSEWTTEAARRSILNTAENIECIYNWIDTDVYKPRNNADEVREKYGIATGRKLILGVSQVWSKEKGIDEFVMLADRLSDKADIILVGDAGDVPERANIKCIGFTSSVEELVEFYSAADVLVNASEAETFGLVTVEAMACGTPVVAYDNSGSAEIVTENCGILAEDGNKEALLSGVTDILGKGKKIFSTPCREHVCQNFEKNRQIEEYIRFYEKISSADEVY